MNTHEPRPEFVERLRSEVGRHARERQTVPVTAPLPWLWGSRWITAAALAGIVAISMAAGGAVVAASYQAQTNERRQLLASTYAQRADLAKQRLELAKAEWKTTQTRVEIGTLAPAEAYDAWFRVQEAEAQVRTALLNLEEVQVTGQEPLDTPSAPLVGGRDFVGERWEMAIAIPTAAFEVEKMRLKTAQHRFEVGLVQAGEVELVRARIAELEAAIRILKQKIEIRRRFLKGEFNAAIADLEVILAQTEQKRGALVVNLEQAKRTVERTKTLFQRGLLNQIEVAKAELAVLELTTELSRIDLELAMIQQQLKERRGK